MLCVKDRQRRRSTEGGLAPGPASAGGIALLLKAKPDANAFPSVAAVPTPHADRRRRRAPNWVHTYGRQSCQPQCWCGDDPLTSDQNQLQADLYQPIGTTDNSDVAAALLSANTDLEPPAVTALHGAPHTNAIIGVPGHPGHPGQVFQDEPPGMESEVDNDGDAMFRFRRNNNKAKEALKEEGWTLVTRKQ